MGAHMRDDYDYIDTADALIIIALIFGALVYIAWRWT
jgi:hypothetical protein